MTDDEMKKLALDGLIWRAAYDSLGVYCQSVTGPDGYEKRTEKMEGWNDCHDANFQNYRKIKEWVNAAPPRIQSLVLERVIEPRNRDDGVVGEIWCNDVFFWGCSDAEEFKQEDLPELERALEDCRKETGSIVGGEILWIARKRKERPQGAFYAYVPEALGRLFDQCGEYRPPEIGNPIGSSVEEGKRYREKMKNSHEGN